MSKDQAIGGAIFIVCIVVAIGYLVTLFYPDWLVQIGLLSSTANVQFWVIAVPVFVAFVAIMFIGAWIGWTMATTPPPKPIEEIATEIEEKKEEPKVEEPMETKTPEAPAPAEEKTPERKRKTEKPQ
jgi:predicted DNA-binding transcriptional regulator